MLTIQIPRALESELGTVVPPDLTWWRERRCDLSFVYSRALGDVLQTGVTRLTAMDGEYLELKSDGTTSLYVIREARYSTKPQMFFSAGFLNAREIQGVSIYLKNGDWLFLCTRQRQDLVHHGHLQV
jgi:hypothetical protein